MADISPDGKTVYVGGKVKKKGAFGHISCIHSFRSFWESKKKEDNTVRVYELNEGAFTLAGELTKNVGNITALAVHPELNLIAVGDSIGKIFVYDTETKTTIIQNWVFHSSRITSLHWSPCGNYLASGSIDTNVYVWDRQSSMKKVAIKNAHVDAVNTVRFLNKTSELTIASVGQDAAVRVWEIKF